MASSAPVAHISPEALIELQRAEQLFRASFEQSPVCMGRASLQGDLLEVNPTFCRWLGYERSELLKKHATDITHPDDRHATQIQTKRMNHPGSRFSLESRYLRKDGTTVWGRAQGATICDDAGLPSHVEIVVQDISERKHSEEVLRESNERFRAIVTNANAVVFVIDTNGIFVLSEGRALAALGLRPGEVVGQSAWELYADFPSILHGIRQALDGKVHHDIIEVGPVFFDIFYSPYRNGMGEVIGTVGMAVDVTARQILEQRVRQSQKMEAVGTLAGGIAHDMNNVLAVVMGCASILESGMLPTDPDLQDIREILAAARRGRSMVDKLLGFARKGSYQKEPTALNAVVRELALLLKRALSKQVQVTTDLEADLATVECDTTQVMQTLMNLCLNSNDAIDSTGNITISTRNIVLGAGQVDSLPTGRYVEVQVTDDGPGMDEDTREKAFEPFFTTKEVGEGTGLGLSMAYGVMKNHGGAIRLRSSVGNGTTVLMWFPISSAAMPQRRVQNPPAATRELDGAVLLVDDEQMIRTMAKHMLETTGHTVMVAASGTEAVEIYQEQSENIAVVLLDLSMPGMDGAECFDKLKAVNSLIRVIICTGHGSPKDTEAMLRKGALRVLRKPFDVHQMNEAIEQALPSSSKSQDAAPHRER